MARVNKINQTKKYTLDSKGSLGLLALGDIGLREWRKFKKENPEENVNESE